MESATFHTVIGICSALFSPDYPVEDKMHKAQACEVFYEYCALGTEEESQSIERARSKAKKGMK